MRCSACTIWPPSAVPATPSANDPSSVELGVKFTLGRQRHVTGIRFYKGTGNTGTHVGQPVDPAGTKLATVTFTGESATGWQQANFATPVAITANTTYVASYSHPAAHYAGDSGYFATAGVDSAAAARAARRRRRRQRRLRLRRQQRLPDQHLQLRPTTGSTSCSPPPPPTHRAGRTDRRDGHRRRRLGDVSWTAAERRRCPITGYTVTPFIGAAARRPTTVTGTPPATSTTVTGLTNGTAYTFKVTGAPTPAAPAPARRLQRRHPDQARCVLGVHDLAALSRPGHPRAQRHHLGRAGGEVQLGGQRQGHRHPLLQGHRQHRHPRGQPVDPPGPSWPGDLHRRERHRLAASQLRHPGDHHRQHHLRRLLLAPNGRYAGDTATSPPAWTGHPCTHCADGSTAATASTATAPAAGFPTSTFNVHQLLGRRRVRHNTAPRTHRTGRADRCDGHRR